MLSNKLCTVITSKNLHIEGGNNVFYHVYIHEKWESSEVSPKDFRTLEAAEVYMSELQLRADELNREHYADSEFRIDEGPYFTVCLVEKPFSD